MKVNCLQVIILLFQNKTFNVIRKDLDVLEGELIAAVSSHERLITDIGTHLVKSGGKRLRPALFLLAVHTGADFNREKAMPLATALELIHMASLVHDDVIDHADTRRGTPTANYKWGNQTAVLSGDYIFAKAFSLVAEEGYGDKVAAILAGLICDLSIGEIIQNREVYKASCDIPEYYERIARKTANFLAACCELGALVAGLEQRYIDALKTYGYDIGMAFQITDDLLDITSDKKTIGKPAGNDIHEGIVTLPVIRALETSPDSDELRTIVTNRDMTMDDVKRAIEIVKASDGIMMARRKASEYIADAKAALPDDMSEKIANSYIRIADYIADRKS